MTKAFIKKLVDSLTLASNGLKSGNLVDYSKGCTEAEKMLVTLEEQNRLVPPTRNKTGTKIDYLWIRFIYALNAELRRNVELLSESRDKLFDALGILK